MMSVIWPLVVVWLGYTLRAWWVARDEFGQLPLDTKAFYMLVTPPLSLALDLIVVTDKMLYSPDRRAMGLR